MASLGGVILAPFEEDRDIKTLLILSVFTLLSPLILPLFFLSGYYAKTANHTGKGLPKIDNYLDLFVLGAKVWAGRIALFVIYIALIMPVVLAEPVIGTTAVDVIIFLTLPIFLYTPALVAGIGRSGRFTDGFTKSNVSRAFSLDYLGALFGILVTRIVYLVVALVLFITVVGILLLPFLHVYRKLVAWRIVGYLFNEEYVNED